MMSSKSQIPVSLSGREVQILELVAIGLTNLEISEKLEISNPKEFWSESKFLVIEIK
jgi:DNA-binding NarL/FixJ family response regulator